MGVIVLSLAMAAIGLPLLLRSDAEIPPPDPFGDAVPRTASATAALAEIARINALHAAPDSEAEIYAAAATLVSRQYLHRLQSLSRQTDGALAVRPDTRVLREVQLAAVRAERKSIFLMRRQQTISATMARRLVRELDLLEAHYES